MPRDKQIEEMAKDVFNSSVLSTEDASDVAKSLYNRGYRKIYDDLQRQCTCYALGCQMAEEFKKKGAMEIVQAADEIINLICAMTGIGITAVGGKYLELRKKYTEDKGNENHNGDT